MRVDDFPKKVSPTSLSNIFCSTTAFTFWCVQ